MKNYLFFRAAGIQKIKYDTATSIKCGVNNIPCGKYPPIYEDASMSDRFKKGSDNGQQICYIMVNGKKYKSYR